MTAIASKWLSDSMWHNVVKFSTRFTYCRFHYDCKPLIFQNCLKFIYYMKYEKYNLILTMTIALYFSVYDCFYCIISSCCFYFIRWRRWMFRTESTSCGFIT
jgi:hypothetical protein